MSVSTTSHRVEFQDRAKKALQDASLQRALAKARGGFVDHRQDAIDALPEFDAIRYAARDIKNHVLANLDGYLELYEQQVIENGGQVHWARDAEEACQIIAGICKDAEAKTVTKGKSMVSEEMHLNPVLEETGITVVETDLGEYIVQLAGETPSHIIAPAVHKTREQITDLFHEHHSPLGYTDRVT